MLGDLTSIQKGRSEPEWRNDLIQGLHTVHFPLLLSLHQTHSLLIQTGIFHVEYSMNHFRHTNIKFPTRNAGKKLFLNSSLTQAREIYGNDSDLTGSNTLS